MVFVTSADRPFSESERAFLTRIRDWGKKIVIVINKIDILQTSGDLDRVEAYVKENARQLLGVSPEVFPVSSRIAFRAKAERDASLLRDSRFEVLEDYIVRKLDQQERVRLKLLNPLGVGCHLAEKHVAALEQELEALRLDLRTLEQVESQLALYRSDMSREFRLRLSDVENVLHELEARGHEFVEDMVRLPRIYDLLHKEKVKGEFVRKVVADAPERIEKRVDDVIDWIVASDLKQWQLLKEHVARRRSEQSRREFGELNSAFDYDRSRLVDSVGRTVQKTLESYDRNAEASRMAESVQGAVAGTALIEVGAVGLGTVVALVASTTAADVTGFLAAGVLATIGFLIIPNKRRAAKRELRDKIAALRERLTSALTRQFDSEVERSVRRLREGIAPYSGFVRAQAQNLAEIRGELSAVHSTLLRLREEVAGLGA